MKSIAEIDSYYKLITQLDSLLSDITDLSKKSPNDGLNKFKLKFVNQLLETANSILPIQSRPFADFKKFSEEDIPTNSDVVMIISQYVGCLARYKSKNIQKDPRGYKMKWIVNGKMIDREA